MSFVLYVLSVIYLYYVIIWLFIHPAKSRKIHYFILDGRKLRTFSGLWLFEHYSELSNIYVLVTGWWNATDRVALLVDISIAAMSLLAGRQYNGRLVCG